MQPSTTIRCPDLPCQGVRTERFTVPDIDLDPAAIRILAVVEAPPVDPDDDFYAPGDPFYLQTTRAVFGDAGIEIETMQDIIDLGIYVTPATKCAKVGYTIKIAPIRACSYLLEQEMALFPNPAAILALGDTAIKAVNAIARRRTVTSAIRVGRGA